MAGGAPIAGLRYKEATSHVVCGHGMELEVQVEKLSSLRH